MTIWQSIFLGILQGLTEFLPISSSGHLVVIPYLLGWQFGEKEAFVFNVLIQVATLIAVIAFFWKDLWLISRSWVHGLASKSPFGTFESRMGWYLILASLPAGLVGFLFKGFFEKTFSNPLAGGVFLIGTAGLLLIGEKVGKRNRILEELDGRDALLIGCFQILALFPGISRSGSTITGGMLRNLDRSTAARFSFLMAVPIMLAAGVVAILDLFTLPNLLDILPSFILGFIASAVVGYLSIRWLIGYLTRRSLYLFSIYCTTLACITMIVYLFNN